MTNKYQPEEEYILAFSDNQHEFSFVGKILCKENGKLKWMFAKFEICWSNFSVVQWNEGMLSELQKYISNNLDPNCGLVAVLEFKTRAISIVKKKIIKKSEQINFEALQCELSKELAKISTIIVNCFYFTGLKRSILALSTEKNKLSIFHKFFKETKKERRSFYNFLSELLLRKATISLIKSENSEVMNSEFLLVLPEVQQIEKKEKFYEYFEQVNKELAKFVGFFEENGKKYGHQGKIQQVCNFCEKKGDIEIHGGISKVMKIHVEDELVNSKTLREIRIKDKVLAKKCFKTEQEIDNVPSKNDQMRFDREIEQIQYLSNKQSVFKDCYLLNYYLIEKAKNYYYADWYELSLNAYLKIYQGLMKLEQKLHIAIQIVFIVLDLHKLGMVHRDLKSSNFMLDTSGSKPVLKLIDLSDSIIIGDEVMLQNVKEENPILFSTPLYCPIETSTLHDNHKEIGLNKPEIDFWSVGILLYEIFHGSIPVSFSSFTSKDILTLWPTEFLHYVEETPRNNTMIVHQIIVFLTSSLCKTSQKERMRLETVLTILLAAYWHLMKDDETREFFSKMGVFVKKDSFIVI